MEILNIVLTRQTFSVRPHGIALGIIFLLSNSLKFQRKSISTIRFCTRFHICTVIFYILSEKVIRKIEKLKKLWYLKKNHTSYLSFKKLKVCLPIHIFFIKC